MPDYASFKHQPTLYPIGVRDVLLVKKPSRWNRRPFNDLFYGSNKIYFWKCLIPWSYRHQKSMRTEGMSMTSMDSRSRTNRRCFLTGSCCRKKHMQHQKHQWSYLPELKQTAHAMQATVLDGEPYMFTALDFCFQTAKGLFIYLRSDLSDPIWIDLILMMSWSVDLSTCDMVHSSRYRS